MENMTYVPENEIMVPYPEAVSYEIQARGDAAFAKGLAAAIISEMPIGSIIAIFMGSKALKMAESTYALAAQYGQKVSGKCIAAKVLGKIGKIVGIAMTAFWAFYFFWIILYIIIMIAIAITGNAYV